MLGMPVGVSAILAVVVAAAVAIGGLYAFRHFVKFEIREGHNEIAGFVFATVGVLYAVVLAFVVFAVWERFTASEESVAHEGALVVSAYRDTEEFPEPERTQAQLALRTYVQGVMDKEWANHGELLPHDKPDSLNPVWTVFRAVAERPGGDRAAAETALDHLHEVELARHERHLSAERSLPQIFWIILILGAVVTLVFAFLFDMGNPHVQGILTAMLAGLIVALLFLAYSLDRPFTGPVQVTKNPLLHAQLVFGAIDLPPAKTAETTPTKVTAKEPIEALIPAALEADSCTVQPAPLHPGAVQSVICAPPLTGCLDRKPCPDRWELSTFKSAAALTNAYEQLRKANSVARAAGKCNGVTWGGEGPWEHGPTKPGGRRFCYFDGHDAVVVWAHDKLGQASHVDVLGAASLGGSDHQHLYNWWNFWHHEIGKCQEEGCVAKVE